MDATKAKRRLLLLRVLIVACIALSAVGIVCLVSHGILKAATYRQLVDISSATAKDIRLDSYISAIRLEPGKTDAYLRLLDTYAEDGLLDKQESEEFLSLYNANHHKLRKHTDSYAQLHKRIGLLYINGYDDSTTTCIRMALPFLVEADTYLEAIDPEKQTVSCYCKIGSYYQNYIWNAAAVLEVSPNVMESLMLEIEEALSQFHQNADTGSVYDYLGFSVAVCNLMYDQRDILAATIPYDRTMAILNSIYENLPDIESLQRERTKELLQILEENRETYYDMTERAYTRREGA